MLFEYSLLTDKKEVEPLTDFLMDKGAYSVSIEDADAETEREKPIFGEPGIEIDDFAWDSSRLKVLCGDDFDMEGALEAALKEELLVAKRIPESKVTLTQSKPLASFVFSTLAFSTLAAV